MIDQTILPTSSESQALRQRIPRHLDGAPATKRLFEIDLMLRNHAYSTRDFGLLSQEVALIKTKLDRRAKFWKWKQTQVAEPAQSGQQHLGSTAP